ncbi:MAG: dihydrofolate reductase [Bacteroidia bacterium]|jgi:dihydrofolate reductase
MLALIVAAAQNGAIGKDNQLLWHISDDLKRFKALTMGKTCIMGRKTYESIGKPLPGRNFVIISRQAGYQVPGALVVSSFEAALRQCVPDQECMVIGGAEIYKLALPKAKKIYLTRVHADFEADTFFPDLGDEWMIENMSPKFSTDNGLEYQYFDLFRK